MSRELHRGGGDGGGGVTAASLKFPASRWPSRSEETRRDATRPSRPLDNYYDYLADESIKSESGWHCPRSEIKLESG